MDHPFQYLTVQMLKRFLLYSVGTCLLTVMAIVLLPYMTVKSLPPFWKPTHRYWRAAVRSPWSFSILNKPSFLSLSSQVKCFISRPLWWPYAGLDPVYLHLCLETWHLSWTSFPLSAVSHGNPAPIFLDRLRAACQKSRLCTLLLAFLSSLRPSKPTISLWLQPGLPWSITSSASSSLIVNSRSSCSLSWLTHPETWHPPEIFWTTCIPQCCSSSQSQGD